MNSDEGCTALMIGPRRGAPRSILILTIVLDAVLVLIGLALLFPISQSFNSFGMRIDLSMANAHSWFSALTLGFVPAIVYAVGGFRYGRALFGQAEPIERTQAWWRLLQLSAVLFTATILLDVLHSIHDTPWGILIAGFLIWGGLIALWAYIGRKAEMQANCTGTVGFKLKASLLGGSAMILLSSVLDVDYASPGWRVLIWRGEWPTLQFVAIDAAVPWLKALCLAGYAAGLLLAVLSVWAALLLLAKKPLGTNWGERLTSLSVVVFWFAVTNYFFSCLLELFVGIFLGRIFGAHALEFVLITAAWLVMLVTGILLWFKYRLRDDEQSRRVKTALLLWALPLVPVTITRFPDALGWNLYGLILFELGVMVVTTCWWSIAETQRAATVPSSSAVAAVSDKTSGEAALGSGLKPVPLRM